LLVEAQKQFWVEKSDQHKIIKTLPELFSLSYEDYLERMQIVSSIRTDYIESVKDMITELPHDGSHRPFFISPQDYELYRELSLRHGIRNQFATPYLSYCFDYIYKNKDMEPHLKIMEAAIQPECLNRLKTRYWQDKNIDVNFYKDDFQWKIQNHNSIINEWLGRDG